MAPHDEAQRGSTAARRAPDFRPDRVRVVVVDAPTARTGFQLALRLPRYRCRTAQAADGGWRVSVDLADEEGLAALVETVQRWLAQEQVGATNLRVGDEVHRLSAGTTFDDERTPTGGGSC